MSRPRFLFGAAIAALSIGHAASAADAPRFTIDGRPIADASGPDPYTNPAALEGYLGDGFLTRLLNYYKLEMGHDGAAAGPQRAVAAAFGLSAGSEAIPPYPFAEWPYGGTSNLGSTRPNSVDSR